MPRRVAHHDLGTILRLQQRGAAKMIGMAMRDNYITNIRRIQPELGHCFKDSLLDLMREHGIKQYDAFAGTQRPGRVHSGSKEMQIIKSLPRRQAAIVHCTVSWWKRRVSIRGRA